MKRYKLKLIFCSLLIFITACSTIQKSSKIGENGYLDTDSLISKDGVKVVDKFKPEYKELVYVVSNESLGIFHTFFIETLKSMAQFKQVLAKEDLEALVLNKEITHKVPSVSDKIGLHNLQEEIGTFLVVEPSIVWTGTGPNNIYKLKAYDPETGKTILSLENNPGPWSGLGIGYFYPLFNAFIEWVNGKEITTKP